MSVDEYFALAERLGYSSGHSYGHRRLRAGQYLHAEFPCVHGRPFLLEELLARHPKLRVQVMHAGYPLIDNMLALLQANSYVYGM